MAPFCILILSNWLCGGVKHPFVNLKYRCPRHNVVRADNCDTVWCWFVIKLLLETVGLAHRNFSQSFSRMMLDAPVTDFKFSSRVNSVIFSYFQQHNSVIFSSITHGLMPAGTFLKKRNVRVITLKTTYSLHLPQSLIVESSRASVFCARKFLEMSHWGHHSWNFILRRFMHSTKCKNGIFQANGRVCKTPTFGRNWTFAATIASFDWSFLRRWSAHRQQKKPHTIGGTLVKPCALEMAWIMLGEASKKTKGFRTWQKTSKNR